MLPEKRNGSDDSSEEDEPIAPAVSTTDNQPEGLSRAWMDAEEDDEEEEDAEWSQLANNAPAAAAPKHESKKTPKFKRCLAAVDKDRWNSDAWIALMNEVQQLSIDEARAYYERFLDLYPSSGRWWKLYAEHELREKNYDRVQEIIKKSLMQIRCPNVDLWRFYLNFTKVVKLDVAVDSKDPEGICAARQLMCDAYELAIERVGASIHAAPIWQAYLSFLQEDTDPQAFLVVRKAFHRALVMPLNNMEAIWKDYEKFERSIPNNDALAQNFFKMFRQKFDASRAVFRDRKKLYDAVNINALSVPVSITKAEAAQMTGWQKILEYETQNPERLDGARFKSRMRFTLELFVNVMRHHPEAWYQYAAYENETNDPDAATAVFDRALEANPDSSLLHFAFADHYELRGNMQGATSIYEKVLKENVSALAYITYQRFARRALGAKGLNEARNIFKRARKDERDGACTYHVFAASGAFMATLLEFYSDSSDVGKEVALKIFELGLKKFIQEPNYVICYLDFLGHLNDDNNMRSLFEKVLAVMPAEVSRPIWDRYVEFEHTMVANGGDLSTVAKVEARRALAFPDAPHIEMKGLLSIAHRYSFLDLQPPSSNDQKCLMKYGVQRRSALAKMEDGLDARDLDGSNGFGVANGAAPDSETNPFDDTDRVIPGPPLPEFLKPFATMLPLHLPWNGPIADVEHIYRAMLLVDFPPRTEIEVLEQMQQQQQIKQQVALQHQHGDAGRGRDDGGEFDAAPGVVSKRPAHDVFRSRQKQKLAKL
ncbi:TPA: hypothetical protein N0F65_010191 [Lagenidium giganteum]|uniref:Suppressor of forked domain-containing protein n=1 Tax=Lagenidium giganteum TaxID=4803 RepID=A0AAV2Z373_9STRA|nr:TPA: hypothetical protein N0F65_010191 [Lagenidium giganteum]